MIKTDDDGEGFRRWSRAILLAFVTGEHLLLLCPKLIILFPNGLFNNTSIRAVSVRGFAVAHYAVTYMVETPSIPPMPILPFFLSSGPPNI